MSKWPINGSKEPGKLLFSYIKDRLIYNNALVSISLHSSLIEIPSNLACCGKILSLVIPDRVNFKKACIITN